MGLTRQMTLAEKDAFCETAKSSLNYQSNSYRVKEIRLWVESWQSLWLPENSGSPEDFVRRKRGLGCRDAMQRGGECGQPIMAKRCASPGHRADK
jgi:hypothetical protein